MPLHQGLILRLYHFHLALCPPNPISIVRVEEIEPPIMTNISSTESKGPIRKMPLVTTKTHKPKPNAKKFKGSVRIAQSSVVVGLCELKSTPTNFSSKPTTKNKVKDEGKGLMEPPTTENRLKNVVGRESKGDTMVAATMETGGKNPNIRRSSRLAKNNKKVKINEMETDKEQSDKKGFRDVEEYVEGPHTISDFNKVHKENSNSQSSNPLDVEHTNIEKTMDKGDDLHVL